MHTIYTNQEIAVTYRMTKSFGLEVWTVSVNNTDIATHMSEGGARAHVQRLVKKLAV